MGQGVTNLHCHFHLPFPVFMNVLLDGAPEEFLVLPLLIPILLRVPIHDFPILVQFCIQDVTVGDVMAVRSKFGINKGWCGSEDNVVDSLDDAGRFIPG